MSTVHTYIHLLIIHVTQTAYRNLLRKILAHLFHLFFAFPLPAYSVIT